MTIAGAGTTEVLWDNSPHKVVLYVLLITPADQSYSPIKCKGPWTAYHNPRSS